ncbi:hypothetical protein BATDEDRAFT_25945 [Batrachochytrium dendrobatidis JAM81]|uniref:Programmed cell death protein 5 n=2 Tax=Batrachochytrium dendrobatidis TaxID=109871 RepID=F4P639_BATDJ|nr:uncharacterized protein BATDEDRAFT_25945 [Batrachochytrium dendrobatidis JAM81]EGF79537.1 hypothetical protein BATDEDRAFT_25945 [Batrachochytrium dendrobatidis JAM81]KAJ8322934.1 hypothetical protein O5D80_008453 [Batrachochytrium dendrobatidis]KAK5665747.1 hypothetical protein QVD99_007385 [Batrachochytrium dendrobatidis]OAJ42686.1 hypothetical protein BDEG_26108 [Batrachochytrium dendrobatidis JEL423]|eukprot:XP_006679915.1 hypothetical protein BATDEDRAFT_25945 [Batrachochytrium dendrobatidis JAM81]
MEDSELAAIRARRMAEMKAQSGGSQSSDLSSILGQQRAGSGDAAAEAKKNDQEEMRRNMVYQILDNGARERLARIKMVKGDKARAVEDMLIRMAQTGQIRGKVGESQLIDLLEQINTHQQSSTKITYNRRRDEHSDEEDWDL